MLVKHTIQHVQRSELSATFLDSAQMSLFQEHCILSEYRPTGAPTMKLCEYRYTAMKDDCPRVKLLPHYMCTVSLSVCPLLVWAMHLTAAKL